MLKGYTLQVWKDVKKMKMFFFIPKKIHKKKTLLLQKIFETKPSSPDWTKFEYIYKITLDQ